MVKQFFSSILHIAFIVCIIGTSMWGLFNPIMEMAGIWKFQYASTVNSVILLVLSCWMLYHIKELLEDISYNKSRLSKSLEDPASN